MKVDSAVGGVPWTLRAEPVGPDDREWLLHLFATTLPIDLQAWPPDHAAGFVRMQFDAQLGEYARSFPNRDHRVVVADGVPAGQIQIDRSGPAIHIVDLSLLPAKRGRGLGRALVAEVVSEATVSGRRVLCSVFAENQAWLRTLLGLGFVIVAEQAPYLRLEWRPFAEIAAG